jgi:hypothetical protein
VRDHQYSGQGGPRERLKIIMEANNTGQLDNTVELRSRGQQRQVAEPAVNPATLPHAQARQARKEAFLINAERQRRAKEAEKAEAEKARLAILAAKQEEKEKEKRRQLDMRLAEAEAEAKEQAQKEEMLQKELEAKEREALEKEQRELQFEAAQQKLREAKALRDNEASLLRDMETDANDHMRVVDSNRDSSENKRSAIGTEQEGNLDISAMDYSDTWFMSDGKKGQYSSQERKSRSSGRSVGSATESDDDIYDNTFVVEDGSTRFKKSDTVDLDDEIPDHTVDIDIGTDIGTVPVAVHPLRHDSSYAEIVDEDDELRELKGDRELSEEEKKVKRHQEWLSKIDQIVEDEYDSEPCMESQDMGEGSAVSLSETQENVINEGVAAMKINQYNKFIQDFGDDGDGFEENGQDDQLKLIKSMEYDAFDAQYGSAVAYWHTLTEEWDDAKSFVTPNSTVMNKSALHFLLSLGISDEYQQQVENILRFVHGELISDIPR